MKTFIVRIAEPEWRAYDYTVEAENEADAIDKAFDGKGECEDAGQICLVENMDREVEFVDS